MKEITIWNEEVQKFVVDNVSEIYKTEFPRKDIPRNVFLLIIGKLRFTSLIVIEMGQKDSYIWNETQSKRINLNR